MYLARGVKQCDKLDAATPFTEIVLLLFKTALGQNIDVAVGGYPGHASAYCQLPTVNDLRLLRWFKWGLRSSGILRNVEWYLQTCHDSLSVPSSRIKHEGGTDVLSWNVTINQHCTITEKSLSCNPDTEKWQLHEGVHQLTVQDVEGFQIAHNMRSFNRHLLLQNLPYITYESLTRTIKMLLNLTSHKKVLTMMNFHYNCTSRCMWSLLWIWLITLSMTHYMGR